MDGHGLESPSAASRDVVVLRGKRCSTRYGRLGRYVGHRPSCHARAHCAASRNNTGNLRSSAEITKSGATHPSHAVGLCRWEGRPFWRTLRSTIGRSRRRPSSAQGRLTPIPCADTPVLVIVPRSMRGERRGFRGLLGQRPLRWWSWSRPT